MDPGSREEHQSLAFLELLAAERNLDLRPPGYITRVNLGLLGVSLGKEKEEGKALRESMSKEAIMDEIHAYFFIQAGPPKDVACAIREFRKELVATSQTDAFEAFMLKWVDPFIITLPAEKKSS